MYLVQSFYRMLWLLNLPVWEFRAINLAKAVIMEKKFVYSKEDNIIDLSREGRLENVSCTDVWYLVNVASLLRMGVSPLVDRGPVNKLFSCASLLAYTLCMCGHYCSLWATRLWNIKVLRWKISILVGGLLLLYMFYLILLSSWVPQLYKVMSQYFGDGCLGWLELYIAWKVKSIF